MSKKRQKQSSLLGEYMQRQPWQIEAIKEGVKSADRGKFATEDEVRWRFKKWGIDVES